LERARPGLIVNRLPLFALGWLLTTVVWGFVLVLDSRLAIFPATLLFVFQLGVLITAIAICHHGARPARIPIVALAACVLLSLSSTSLFAAIGGYGEMLAFILLTLFLASSPLFAWSGRAALILFSGTLIPWLLAIPFLHFFLRPLELTAAIAIGAGVSLIVLEGSKRNAKIALERSAQGQAPRDAVAAPESPVTAASGVGSMVDDRRPIDGEVALLCEPLRILRDEEVKDLRKEVRRLRVAVNQHLVKLDGPPEELVEEKPRRRRR